MITYIYTLSHPITGEVKYVGKTINPKQRKHNHTNRARDRNTHKRNWINQLMSQGLKAKFEIIDEVEDNWRFWEKWWIAQFKAWGYKLCNHTEGGDGLSMINQTSFRPNHIPWNKGGTHSEETKQLLKLRSTGQVSSRRIPVEQYDLQDNYIATYVSALEASKIIGGIPIKISNVCHGKRKSHKGFKWKFKIIII